MKSLCLQIGVSLLLVGTQQQPLSHVINSQVPIAAEAGYRKVISERQESVSSVTGD